MSARQGWIVALGLLAPLGAGAEQVSCESRDRALVECAIDTGGPVRVVRQLGKTKCVEGVNWGLYHRAVWVKDGCRAVFARHEWRPGRDGWGRDAQRDRPDERAGARPREVTCESRDRRRAECPMDTDGQVRLVRRLSNSPCVEGRSWGTSRHMVWVDDGCRASFALERGAAAGATAGGPPVSAHVVAACDSRFASSGRLESWKELPGAWEMVLRYPDGRYVCVANALGGVTRLDKLR